MNPNATVFFTPAEVKLHHLSRDAVKLLGEARLRGLITHQELNALFQNGSAVGNGLPSEASRGWLLAYAGSLGIRVSNGGSGVCVPKAKAVRSVRKTGRKNGGKDAVVPLNGSEEDVEAILAEKSLIEPSPRERSNVLSQYLSEMGKHPLLPREEEIELARRVQQGDRTAWEQLVKSNLRLVVWIAKKYWRWCKHLHLLDLIQEGNVGLMKAVETFNPESGYSFCSYAKWRIRSHIARAIANLDRTVRLPINVWHSIGRYKRAVREFEKSFGQEPSFDEISSALELSEGEIAGLRRYFHIQLEVSTEKLAGDDGDTTLGSLLPDTNSPNPEDEAADESLSRLMGEKLCLLKLKEQNVISLRFGLEDHKDRTLEEVGKEMDLTKEQVRQIEKDAVRKLLRYIDPDMIIVSDERKANSYEPEDDLSKLFKKPLEKIRHHAPFTQKGIISAVCRFYSLTEEEIYARTDRAQIAWPRQIVFYLLRTDAKFPFEDIGRIFEQHPSTVMHGSAQVQAIRQDVSEVAEVIRTIRSYYNPFFADA